MATSMIRKDLVKLWDRIRRTTPVISEPTQRVANSGFFDPVWYLEKNPDVAAAHMSPLEHYVRHGALEYRSPGPKFDALWYVTQYPDIRGINPLLHYIDHGSAEGRRPCPPPGILEASQKVLNSIIDLEPQLYTSEAFANLSRLAIVDGTWRGPVASAFDGVFNTLRHPFDYLVFAPWLIHGGADLVTANLVKAISECCGPKSALVVTTEQPWMDGASWFPAKTEVRAISAFAPDLDTYQKRELVETLIQAIRPRCVVNINSWACWNAFVHRGAALSTFTRLYAGIFCRDYAPDGRPGGYADTHFREALPFLSGVILDNQQFALELYERFAVPEDLQKRFYVLHQPAPTSVPTWNRTKKKKNAPFSVLWAGRVCRQKNVELLMQTIRLSPDISYEIWGSGEAALLTELQKVESQCTNLKLRGPYESFSALPISNYDAFLYTTLWDGLPNVLLEAGKSGIPVVTSMLGGIGELIDETTGWPITDYENPLQYLTKLREIRSNPTDAAARAARLLTFITSKRSWKKYLEALDAVDGFWENKCTVIPALR
jgi:glycosyltransferase involved in cell wall biosynthesis